MRRAHLALAAMMIAAPTLAHAQAMRPMKQVVTSVLDTASVAVEAINPSDGPRTYLVRVYDKDFRLIRASVNPRRVKLGGGEMRKVRVVVPFEGKKVRPVFVCTESTDNGKGTFVLRTRVCGKFLLRRL